MPVSPERMNEFHAAVASGNFALAGRIAAGEGFSPDQVTQYLNTGDNAYNLGLDTGPIDRGTVASYGPAGWEDQIYGGLREAKSPDNIGADEYYRRIASWLRDNPDASAEDIDREARRYGVSTGDFGMAAALNSRANSQSLDEMRNSYSSLEDQFAALNDAFNQLRDQFNNSGRGGANDGGADDGGADDGGANDGGADDGGANDGGADDGGANDAITNPDIDNINNKGNNNQNLGNGIIGGQLIDVGSSVITPGGSPFNTLKVYGPDGTEYPSAAAAIAAGVKNFTYSRPLNVGMADTTNTTPRLFEVGTNFTGNTNPGSNITDVNKQLTNLGPPKVRLPAGVRNPFNT